MAFPYDIDGTWVNSAGVSYDAGELRRADMTAFAGAGDYLAVRGGIVRHSYASLTVTVDGSDVVTVFPGSVVIPGNAVSGTGCYRAASPSTVTGSLAARNATNSRIDLVVFRQMDTDVVGTHGAYKSRIEIIDGTPSGSPVVPTLPSMAVELARITVPASGGGAASVDYTWRTYASALGGTLVVPTAARLPATATTPERARALDTGVQYEWNGSSWIVIPRVQRGSATVTVGASTAEASTGVTFPYAFASTPSVVVTQKQGSPVFYNARHGSASASGVTIYAEKTGTSGSTTVAVDWIAVGD